MTKLSFKEYAKLLTLVSMYAHKTTVIFFIDVAYINDSGEIISGYFEKEVELQSLISLGLPLLQQQEIDSIYEELIQELIKVCPSEDKITFLLFEAKLGNVTDNINKCADETYSSSINDEFIANSWYNLKFASMLANLPLNQVFGEISLPF